MPGSALPTIPRLFLTFLRLGVTAFGGPAMVTYIRREAVERQRWLESRQFDDGVALCQMIPGATAMQTAAYVGLSTRGVAGAAASFIGFGLPAFVLMLVLSALYVRTHELPAVGAVFKGLAAVIVAIVANATWSFGERSVRDLRRTLIAAGAAALFAWGGHPFLVIILAGLAGLMLKATGAPAGTTDSHRFGRTAWIIAATAVAGLAALFFARRSLFDLSVLMVRIDLFAFGGGYASVPLMLHEVVTVRHWLNDATFMNGIVLGQVTPGPIVITATFVGYLVQGAIGAMIATVSVFLPSFLLVVAVTPYFHSLRASPAFNRIIAGVLCSFVGLLLNVTIYFAMEIDWDIARAALALAAFVALRLKVDILWAVLVGTIASVILFR